MRNSTRNLLFLFLFSASCFLSSTALAQATVDMDDTKDACNGLNNGSITITVTNGVPPFNYTVFRLSDFTIIFNNVPIALGVPTILSNLSPDSYFIGVTDGDPGPGPNFTGNFVIGNVAAPIVSPF